MLIDTCAKAGSRQKATVALMALLAVVGSMVFASGDARGDSRFVTELCDSALPGGGVPVSSFTANPGAPFVPIQNCASPGGMIGVYENAPAASTFSFLNVSVPETPGGFVEQEAMVSASSGFGQGSVYSHVYENSFPGTNTESSRIFHLRTKREVFFGNGGSFAVVMTCDGNYAPGCQAGPVVGARDIAATQVDIKAPTLTEITGSILAGGVIRGHSQSLAGVAHDEGGGLSKVWASVNGSVAAELPTIGCQTTTVSNPSVVGTVALSPTPCPTKLPATWTLDTEKYPFHSGGNVIAACATDFATIGAPTTSCSTPQEINVDNTCTESPVLGGDQLTSQFKSSESDTVTVKYNGRAKVRGALTSASGAPVAGATLCVKESVLNTFHRVRGEGSITTDANGHYSYEVKGGPNRELLIGYRHDAAQINDSLDYHAHARPEITASTQKIANGDKVRFTGRLPGPNAAERVVEIQASAPGSSRWLTFRKAISDKRGQWISGYRFAHTTVPTTYRIRALAPRQKNYPFEEGASRPVRIRVIPK